MVRVSFSAGNHWRDNDLKATAHPKHFRPRTAVGQYLALALDVVPTVAKDAVKLHAPVKARTSLVTCGDVFEPIKCIGGVM
jgi:hypothetical protein